MDLKINLPGDLTKSPEFKYYLTWGGVYIAVIVTGLFVFMALRSKSVEMAARVEGMRSTIRQLEKFTMTGGGREEVLERVKNNLKEQLNQFVSAGEISQVIKEISDQALRSNVKINRINAAGPVPVDDKGLYARLPMEVEVEGEFKRVGNFIGALKKNLVPYFTWDSMDMTMGDVLRGEVKARLVVSFYVKLSGAAEASDG